MADLSSNEWPPGYRPPHVGTFTVPRDSVVTPAFSAEGLRPALVLADSQFTSEGIFDVPAGFLAGLVESAHAAGAMYLADEVQPGYGRSCGGSPWPGSRRTW
jgi:4-aminobutyrate aminotransferase-like enzyme